MIAFALGEWLSVFYIYMVTRRNQSWHTVVDNMGRIMFDPLNLF